MVAKGGVWRSSVCVREEVGEEAQEDDEAERRGGGERGVVATLLHCGLWLVCRQQRVLLCSNAKNEQRQTWWLLLDCDLLRCC